MENKWADVSAQDLLMKSFLPVSEDDCFAANDDFGPKVESLGIVSRAGGIVLPGVVVAIRALVGNHKHSNFRVGRWKRVHFGGPAFEPGQIVLPLVAGVEETGGLKVGADGIGPEHTVLDVLEPYFAGGVDQPFGAGQFIIERRLRRIAWVVRR